MLRNYLKITVRTLQKSKLFSTINISGLSIGMAACLLIMHYVTFEKVMILFIIKPVGYTACAMNESAKTDPP
jgi:hypothetical protein